MPSRVRKRKERYMRWVHACVEYLKETGEKRSANWLFENIDCCNQREGLYKKNVAEGKIRENTQYRPPNVNSASNKLRASGLTEQNRELQEKLKERGKIEKQLNAAIGVDTGAKALEERLIFEEEVAKAKRKQFELIPPKVEYSLSKKSENLLKSNFFKEIEKWIKENY